MVEMRIQGLALPRETLEGEFVPASLGPHRLLTHRHEAYLQGFHEEIASMNPDFYILWFNAVLCGSFDQKCLQFWAKI